MPTPPSGTVTFLFTDIEGSTKLAQAHPAAWEGARQRHHAILRAAVEAHRGHVFQIIGDAFCVAFATAEAGLGAALAGQRGIQSEAWGEMPIRVRMGLHTGAAEAQDGDYLGYLTLAHVQRVMSVAHGAQTLTSSATATLVLDQLPDGITLRDLGEHRLKGLLNLERLWQVAAPDLPQDFPPLQSLNTIPNNLPIQTTSFIGRENELRELQRLLATTRLLTLTGTGGTGKTRLSLQIAATVLEEFTDGVWFVELAPLTDPALVPSTVASVLGVAEQQGYTILNLLEDYLRKKQLLLVLDNCEHLIEACAKFADTVLHAAPHVKVLTSSREALGIAGEQAYPVPSLQLPASRDNLPVEVLARAESVHLFLERAVAVQPRFVLTSANASAVAQICRRLDGIPFAIELAAARVKTLPLELLTQKLDDRFQLLTGGSRTALPRQQTLRATIDWSYNLLSASEQRVLCRLSVFASGWTLQAAEKVCSDGQLRKTQIFVWLMRLVDKSLVVFDEPGEDGAARYHLLETIRQYAREKLLDSGKGKHLRDRHLAYYREWAEQAEPKLKGADQIVWLKQWQLETDNLRTALDWSLEHGVEEGLRLATTSTWFWWLNTRWSEGNEWLIRLLTCSVGNESAVRVMALCRAAHLSTFLYEHGRALAFADEALSWSKANADLRCLADSLFYRGLALLSMADVADALPMFETSLATYRKLKDLWGTAMGLLHVGGYLLLQDRDPRALSPLQESLAIFRQLGDRWGQAITLGNLGRLARLQGHFAKAQVYDEEALVLAKELGNQLEVARALRGLGITASACGRVSDAIAQFEASLNVLLDAGIRTEYTGIALRLGLAKLRQGDDAAATCLSDALERYRAANHQPGVSACLDGLAAVCLAQRQSEHAVQLIGLGQMLLEAEHCPPLSNVDTEREHTLAEAHAQLDDAAFDAAWQKGRELTLEEAVALAMSDSR